MPAGDGYGGRRAMAWVAAVLAEYGTTCHLCGHPDADSADHVQTRQDRPDLMYVVANGRPAHHKRPCPVCGQRCNIVRKSKPLPVAPTTDDVGFFETGPSPGTASRPSFSGIQTKTHQEGTNP